MYSEIFSKIATPQLNDNVVERQKNRLFSSNIPKMIELFNLSAAPVILDIGAGTGQYSYAFAEYLQDNATIYAVEVFKDRYDYIKDQVALRNYKSILPMLLSRSNDDEFYFNNSYDLIFLGNSFEYINNKQNFLSKLRDKLKEHGKLAIIMHRDISPFTEEDILDNAGLLKALLDEKLDSIFYLSEKKEPLASLNYFFNDLDWTAKYFRYCQQLKWLPVSQLDDLQKRTLMGIISFLKREENIFDDNFEIKDPALITPKINLMFKIVNKLVFSDHYKQYLRGDIFKENFFSDFNRMQSSAFLQEIKEVMAAAGYGFAGVYDFIPWYYLVIFNK